MTEHRDREEVSDEDLARVLNRVPSDHYVYWTGGTYSEQTGSGRSEALKTITEAKVPITVRWTDLTRPWPVEPTTAPVHARIMEWNDVPV